MICAGAVSSGAMNATPAPHRTTDATAAFSYGGSPTDVVLDTGVFQDQKPPPHRYLLSIHRVRRLLIKLLLRGITDHHQQHMW